MLFWPSEGLGSPGLRADGGSGPLHPCTPLTVSRQRLNQCMCPYEPLVPCAVDTKAGRKFFRYNLSPTTTILLPGDWCLVGYKFRLFKPARP